MPSMGKIVNMLFKVSSFQQSKHPSDERRCDENRGVRKGRINSSCKGKLRLTTQDNWSR